MFLLRGVLLAGVAAVFALDAASPANAAQDPVIALANSICAAPDAASIGAVLTTLGPSERLSDQDIAQAYGDASFMADLGRCANKQAIYDAFAAFKRGKPDVAELDAAFAMGRVQATPDGGTASVAFYQGSYEALGAAGDPPSGK